MAIRHQDGHGRNQGRHGMRMGVLKNRWATLARRARGLALGLALALPTGQALAQSQIPPPEAYNPTDANGVNLTSGSYSFSTTPISIGPKNGGLTYVRTLDSSVYDWRDNMAGMVNRAPFFGPGTKTPWYTVTMLGSSTVFKVVNGAFQLLQGDNATLVLSGTTYTYTTADGTVAVFDKSQSTYSPYIANEGLITSITRPNGEILSFAYNAITMTGGFTARRLQSVTNNFGYQLKYQYALDGSWSNDWYRVIKVTALNNAIDACDPAAATCTYSRTWPSLSFDDPLTEHTVTDTLGRVTHIVNIAGGWGIRLPATTSGYDATVQWSGDPQHVNSVTTAAGTWTYGFPDPTDPSAPLYTLTNTVTDPLTHTTSVTSTSKQVDAVFNKRVDRLTSVTNALTQTTQYGYATKYQLQSITQPEGNKVQYTYDGLGRIDSITRTPKGSTTAVTVMGATYPTCTSGNLKTCHKPETVTDARGATTVFTYDTAHGGVLTATSPAPTSGAVQPQTRTSYAALQAWFKNSAGTLVAGTAIYLPTATSQCATTTSCAGTADEVKTLTTYEAGSASLASNLLPLTTTSLAGDGSLSAATTVDYNYLGDVRIVDGPLPGNQDATRTYYDVGRQVIGVIGPDPDGAGPLLYRASRTTYNADGQVTLSETGTATSQSDAAMSSFAPLAFTRSTYGPTGKLIKVEAGQP